MNDINKIQRAKDGQRESLIGLINDNRDDYFRLAYVYTRNHHDAMDAVEDMILTVYENLNKLRKIESFEFWAKRILVNICKNKLKNCKRDIELNDIYESEDSYLEIEDKIILKRALEKLKPKYAEVIRLKYYIGMDYKGIAKILRIPEGTAKSRVFNGLKQLRKHMGGVLNG